MNRTIWLIASSIFVLFVSAALAADVAPANPTTVESTPAIRPLFNPPSPPPPPSDGKPTLWIVGDSTVKNGTPGEEGWGEVIAKFFDTSRIHVENHAVGGRSSRTFITEGRWDKILAAAQKGDFVLVQMGHNDGGPINDNSRARGSIRGIGEESQEIDNMLTGKHEVVHTYGWYLRKYINDAKAKGMTVIICSPVPHVPKQTPQAGDLEKSNYVTWSRQVAEAEHVPFIQLNGLIMSHYVGMAPAEIKQTYFQAADNTHADPQGAALNASCVVQGIRDLSDVSLKDFLRDPAPTTQAVTDAKRELPYGSASHG